MKAFLLLLALAGTEAAYAQTVPFNAAAPIRGGAYNQTAVPPANAALNQSTIQGPAQVQRTLTSYDAQPSRLAVGQGVPTTGTPETSPQALPDVREQPLVPQRIPRQSTDVVPSRGVNSSTVGQRPQVQPAPASGQPQRQ